MDERRNTRGVLLLLGAFAWFLVASLVAAGVLITVYDNPNAVQIVVAALFVVLLPATLCWRSSWRLLHVAV